MNPERLAVAMACVSPEELTEFFRAVALLERRGVFSPEDADALRLAARLRAAELSAVIEE